MTSGGCEVELRVGPHSNNILDFIIKHSGKKLALRYVLVAGHQPPPHPHVHLDFYKVTYSTQTTWQCRAWSIKDQVK